MSGEGGMVAVKGALAPDRPTVLLVEDEVLIRLMIADELRSDGLQVLEASSAEEARSILESTLPVHLLFTDIRMPGDMDGLALARFARAHFPQVKRVLASSYRPDESAGVADAFLCKPYDLRDVVAQVRRLLTQADNDE